MTKVRCIALPAFCSALVIQFALNWMFAKGGAATFPADSLVYEAKIFVGWTALIATYYVAILRPAAEYLAVNLAGRPLVLTLLVMLGAACGAGIVLAIALATHGNLSSWSQTMVLGALVGVIASSVWLPFNREAFQSLSL